MNIFPTRILLAVDGSRGSRLAAQADVDLARSSDSALHVVHVASLPGVVYVPEDQERMGGKLTEREGHRLVYVGSFPGILQVPEHERTRGLVERGGRKTLEVLSRVIRGWGARSLKRT